MSKKKKELVKSNYYWQTDEYGKEISYRPFFLCYCVCNISHYGLKMAGKRPENRVFLQRAANYSFDNSIEYSSLKVLKVSRICQAQQTVKVLPNFHTQLKSFLSEFQIWSMSSFSRIICQTSEYSSLKYLFSQPLRKARSQLACG